MRILIINTDYKEFLCQFYSQPPGLEKQPYEEQMRVRAESLFGVADFYSSNLRKLGHEAWDIHVNNEIMQKAWAREHGLKVKAPQVVLQWWCRCLQKARGAAAGTPLRYFKVFFRPLTQLLNRQQSRLYEILKAQIKHYKPDVLLNQAMAEINSGFLLEMKPYMRLLVGQVASPLPQGQDFSCYDLVISSLPSFVDDFRKMGITSELNRFAFEPRVLEKIKNDRNSKQIIPVSFVGSLSLAHKARARWLEYLCQHVDVRVWGTGIDDLPENSHIRQYYMGKSWGIEMYQILHRSRITLNHHIDVAGFYANNMRLYEATGVGTFLITDWKGNLHEIFEPGKEVVVYHSPEECLELIQYYLKHDDERESIACAGQRRIFKEHTYYHRMQELIDIVRKYLR